MKRFLFILMVVFLAVSCSSSGNKSTKDEGSTEKIEMSSENLSELQLHVTGMTCEGCEKSIVTSINKLEGIQEASASHTAEEVKVVYDAGQTDMQALTKAIEDAGYTVEGMKDKSSD